MNRLTIEYDPINGLVQPDGEVLNFVDGFVEEYLKHGQPNTVRVGSELLVAAFRAKVKQKVLKYEQIVFIFNGEELPVDKDGKMAIMPDGFCDVSDKLLLALL